MEIDLRKKVSFYLDLSLFLKSRYVYELGQGLAEEKRMAIIKGLEWTFNTVAEEYDKWSPEYVSELYEDLFDYQPLTLNSEVLEVGIGTGQATLPILRTGCKLTAVELGDQLAELTRRKFKDYVNLASSQVLFRILMTEKIIMISSILLQLFTGFLRKLDIQRFTKCLNPKEHLQGLPSMETIDWEIKICMRRFRKFMLSICLIL